MPETADRDAAADRTEGEPVWVNADGLTVEKVPVSRGTGVVAVQLTLTSNRDERSLVRVVDPLPDAVADKVVEFHPAYDPQNWSKADDAVVYEAPMEPNGERTTVYGVEVDDAEQRELFSTPPTVESAVLGKSSDEAESASDSTDPAGADDARSADRDVARDGSEPFAFESDDEPADGSDASRPDEPSEPRSGSSSAASRDVADHATAQLAKEPAEPRGDDGSVVDALVAELERRDLSAAEREVIGNAVYAGATPEADGGTVADVDARFRHLQERVTDQAEARESLAESIHRVEAGFDSLRDEIASAERQAADVDRLEARLDALAEQLEETTATLAADIEDLRSALDEEVRWRSELSRFLSDADE